MTHGNCNNDNERDDMLEELSAISLDAADSAQASSHPSGKDLSSTTLVLGGGFRNLCNVMVGVIAFDCFVDWAVLVTIT
eukprot:scaffold59310_cov24-Cyclotella_meneghiniana.AAC.3